MHYEDSNTRKIRHMPITTEQYRWRQLTQTNDKNQVEELCLEISKKTQLSLNTLLQTCSDNYERGIKVESIIKGLQRQINHLH